MKWVLRVIVDASGPGDTFDEDKFTSRRKCIEALRRRISEMIDGGCSCRQEQDYYTCRCSDGEYNLLCEPA